MEIGYYADIVNQMLDDDSDRDAGFADIDRAVNVEYDNPQALRDLSWIGNRKFPTTAFADAAHASVRAFATKRPDLTIFPTYDDPAQYAQTERIETAMEWEFERLNRIGAKPVHWQVVESAMKYCAVAIQTEYLPYAFKGREKDPRVKAILRQAKFNWTVHHPATVHARHSRYGLECVAKAVQLTGQQLIEEFGRDNPGIRKLMAEYDKDDIAGLLSTVYNFFDVYTWTDRVQWATPYDAGAGMVADGGGFVFRNEPHEMPFIPWAVVDNKDPIMLPAIRAGLYDNANILNTIAFSRAVDMAAHPELWIQTMDGNLNNVTIDNTNPSQPLVTDRTASVQQLRPPQVDPQLLTMQQEAKSDIFRSTVAQVLADISNIGQTATFSTVNAMLEAAVTQLALGQNAAERAETLAFYQMFQWIEFSRIPLVAYRTRDKGAEKPAGQELIIRANYTGDNPAVSTFDLDQLYLEVRLKSTSITDKQAELNNQVMMVERLGKSRQAAMEDLGQENYEADFIQRGTEDLALATVAAEASRIQMAPQMEAEQAMQAQQAAQQQQVDAQNAQNDQRGQIFSPQEGVDSRAGGTAGAMGAAPGMGNEAMTGQTRGGQGLA